MYRAMRGIIGQGCVCVVRKREEEGEGEGAREGELCTPLGRHV